MITHTEIDALGAGPELDALVAEKVMGWPRYQTGSRTYPNFEISDHGEVLVERERSKYPQWEDWSPSTDANQTLEVIQRAGLSAAQLMELGNHIAVTLGSDLFPLAGCKMALKAVVP